MKRINKTTHPNGWQYDRFQQFTVNLGMGFHQTESGIVFAYLYRADPQDRNDSKVTQLGIELTMPNDGKYDFYINGEKIPVAWLTQSGSPLLCIDPTFETDNVSRIAQHNLPPEVAMLIPTNLDGCGCISLTENHRLQGGLIRVSSPKKPSKAQVDWWNEAQEMAKVLEELDPTELPIWGVAQPVERNLADMTMDPTEWLTSLSNADPKYNFIRWNLTKK